MDLHSVNLNQNNNNDVATYNEDLYSFSRFNDEQKIVVVSNFSQAGKQFELVIPETLVSKWDLPDGGYTMFDLLSDQKMNIRVENQKARISMTLGSLQSVVLNLVD